MILYCENRKGKKSLVGFSLSESSFAFVGHIITISCVMTRYEYSELLRYSQKLKNSSPKNWVDSFLNVRVG